MDKVYAILELSPGTTSPQEIRRAYKRLALKIHPDKPEGDEKKFNELTEAYAQLLSDAAVVPAAADPLQGLDPFRLFRELFRDLDQGGGGGGAAVVERENLQFDLHVTPAELLQGTQKLIAICRQRFCKLCQGQGISADDDVDISCFQCRGSGVQTLVKHAWTVGDPVQTTPCSICHGEGIVIPLSMQKCPTCSGNRLFSEKALIPISVPAGIPTGAVITCKEQGNDSIQANIERGDLLLRIQCQFPPPWMRHAQHLIYHHRGVSLEDCISRDPYRFTLTLLTGETLPVQFSAVIKPNMIYKTHYVGVFVLDHLGFPSMEDDDDGHLFLLLEIDFPETRRGVQDTKGVESAKGSSVEARPATGAEIENLQHFVDSLVDTTK